MEIIGILSILEGQLQNKVRGIWHLFEKEYKSFGVQTFDHPNITFQGGKTKNLGALYKGFLALSKKIKAFNIEINGLGHFDNKVIFLKVKKTQELINLNAEINTFLNNNSVEVFDKYKTTQWVPHITLAMDDLSDVNYKSFFEHYGHEKYCFRNTLHNICTIRLNPNGRFEIVKKVDLTH